MNRKYGIGAVTTGAKSDCVHKYGDFSPVAFGQREGLVEAATCKKCGHEKRRRAK